MGADLADPGWLGRLAAAGWEAGTPTIWVAEGLMYYLPPPTALAVLRVRRGRRHLPRGAAAFCRRRMPAAPATLVPSSSALLAAQATADAAAAAGSGAIIFSSMNASYRESVRLFRQRLDDAEVQRVSRESGAEVSLRLPARCCPGRACARGGLCAAL